MNKIMRCITTDRASTMAAAIDSSDIVHIARRVFIKASPG